MLMPTERATAITLVTNFVANTVNYNLDSIKLILTNGHVGFATCTDRELLRLMQSLSKQNASYDIQQFLQRIAAEKFLLE